MEVRLRRWGQCRHFLTHRQSGKRPRLKAPAAVRYWRVCVLSIAAVLAASVSVRAEQTDGVQAGAGELPADAVPGVTEDRILFGQSAAFTGPAAELGTGMRLGIEAAFAEANRDGGVRGRRLELLTLDDAYEPETAVVNTQKLIGEHGVFALIGAVGTPTSRSATPVAAAAGIPYVAPFTGAAFLRSPDLDNVINLRASYDQETEEMVERLIRDLGIDRIAVMYQDDSFGRAGYRGVRAALERRDMKPVSTGVYPRNTTAVKTGLLDIRKTDPGAVILVGAYQPVAAFIKWARHTGFDPVFVTISFVGSNALANALGTGGAGVVVTQVVPFPTGAAPPVVGRYSQALADHAADATPGFVSFEGYLAGRLAIAALERCGAEVARSTFVQVLRGAEPIDLDGFELRYGENDNQGSDVVFLTMIDPSGRYREVDSLKDLAL